MRVVECNSGAQEEYCSSNAGGFHLTLFVFITSIVLLLLTPFLKMKQRNRICILVMFVYAILIAGSYTNIDYSNYKLSYDMGTTFVAHEKEWLYHLLKVVSITYLKLDYNGFRLLLAIPSILLFASTCKRYTKSYEYVLILYMIFPLFFDVTAIRNFAAMTILLFSVRYLEEYNIKNAVKFVACMVFASGMHILFTAFFILVVVYFANKSKFVKSVLIAATIAGFIVALMPSSLVSVVSTLLSFVNDDRTSKFIGIATRYGYLLWWGFQIIFVLITSFGKRTMDSLQLITPSNVTEEKRVARQKRLVNVVYIISITALLFCPLYRIQANFTRLLKNILPLLYLQCVCVNDLIRCSINSSAVQNRKLLFNSSVVLFAMLYACEIFFAEGLWNSMVIETLSHNWIIEAIFGSGW